MQRVLHRRRYVTETTKPPVSTVDTGGFQISALLRFFERPGGFVEIIIPQIVQKEKRQTRKPAASMRFVKNRTQLRSLY
nr:MAG TPA: hypothetical protein [Caudoviricetes sp.]